MLFLPDWLSGKVVRYSNKVHSMAVSCKKALVLDFGGVITRSPFETHAETEKALGLETGTLTWLGPIEPRSDPLWQLAIASEITEREYWMTRVREVGAMVGESWSCMSEFIRAARGEHPEEIIRPEFLNIFRRTKAAGLGTAILSNELDLYYGPDVRQKLDFIADFDVIHDATYASEAAKPAALAFAGLAQELGIAAVDCVYVDYLPVNVNGAIEAGMQAVLFDVTKVQDGFDQAADLLGIA